MVRFETLHTKVLANLTKKPAMSNHDNTPVRFHFCNAELLVKQKRSDNSIRREFFSIPLHHARKFRNP